MLLSGLEQRIKRLFIERQDPILQKDNGREKKSLQLPYKMKDKKLSLGSFLPWRMLPTFNSPFFFSGGKELCVSRPTVAL